MFTEPLNSVNVARDPAQFRLDKQLRQSSFGDAPFDARLIYRDLKRPHYRISFFIHDRTSQHPVRQPITRHYGRPDDRPITRTPDPQTAIPRIDHELQLVIRPGRHAVPIPEHQFPAGLQDHGRQQMPQAN
jgi:hypothetical protein